VAGRNDRVHELEVSPQGAEVKPEARRPRRSPLGFASLRAPPAAALAAAPLRLILARMPAPRFRRPAVAGLFYPADPDELAASVRACLRAARPDAAPAPRAVIAPHAGYVYSGPVAGSVYARLAPLRGRVRRVVLIGPSHRVGFRGLAVPSADVFTSPLGPVPVDREAVARILALSQVVERDDAHAQEHSLEVQLPFLQEVLGGFALVPIAAGDASAEQVAEVIEALWDGPETLVVVSSDLSHYHDYATARRLDEETTRAIEALDPEGLDEESACGRIGVRGLLLVARRRGLAARTLDLRSSGDTAGPRDRVVGYGAYEIA
jgi:AmmeMemoRadiSam system protein B